MDRSPLSNRLSHLPGQVCKTTWAETIMTTEWASPETLWIDVIVPLHTPSEMEKKVPSLVGRHASHNIVLLLTLFLQATFSSQLSHLQVIVHLVHPSVAKVNKLMVVDLNASRNLRISNLTESLWRGSSALAKSIDSFVLISNPNWNSSFGSDYIQWAEDPSAWFYLLCTFPILLNIVSGPLHYSCSFQWSAWKSWSQLIASSTASWDCVVSHLESLLPICITLGK